MRRVNIIQFTGVVLAVFCLSCDDIFVENISEKTIVIVAPDDSILTRTADHIFVWDELDGVVNYQVIISSGAVIVDTVTTKTSFAARLDTGAYKWCVRGMNSEYKTEFSCRSLKVIEKEVLDISTYEVELVSPSNNVSTEEEKQVFLWEAVPGASQYQLVIASPSISTPDRVVLSKILTNTTYTIALEPGRYEWCVKAINREYKTENSCHFLEIKRNNNDG